MNFAYRFSTEHGEELASFRAEIFSRVVGCARQVAAGDLHPLYLARHPVEDLGVDREIPPMGVYTFYRPAPPVTDSDGDVVMVVLLSAQRLMMRKGWSSPGSLPPSSLSSSALSLAPKLAPSPLQVL